MGPDRFAREDVDEAVRRLTLALDEKQRRRFAGLLAATRGRGGVTHVAALTGLSRTTVLKGRREVLRAREAHPDRVRAPGGGRKPAQKKIPA